MDYITAIFEGISKTLTSIEAFLDWLTQSGLIEDTSAAISKVFHHDTDVLIPLIAEWLAKLQAYIG